MRTTNHGPAQPLRKHRLAIGNPLTLLAVSVVVCLAAVLLVGGSTDAWRVTDDPLVVAIGPRHPKAVARQQAAHTFEHPTHKLRGVRRVVNWTDQARHPLPGRRDRLRSG